MTTKINGTNTAASPALTGADTDTGLSFASDTVNINTGGTTRATVDSSGALDVPTNFPIKVNGSEKLRIDTSGRLGLGSSNPSAGRLVVTSSSDGGFGGSLVLENSNGSDTDKVGIAFRPNGSATTAIGSYGESRIISEYNSGSTNGANNLQFHTHAGNGTVGERMRIDSGGNVLIGTTTDNGFKFKVSDGGGYEFAFAPNDSGVNSLVNYNRSGSAYVPFQVSGSDLRFCSGGNTQRMKILSTGQIHVGPHSTPFTTTTLLNIQRTNGSLFSLYHDGTDNNAASIIKHQRANSSTMGTMIQFNNSGGSAVGSIQSGANGTAYNTTSDYRLKENVTAISDGITRLKTLKPSRFNFKTNKDITVDGFLAHEVTAVPEAISGTKDGMKAETYYREGDTLPSGKVVGDAKTYSSTEPEYQGIDHSKLVPLLTAALQEAITEIETLKTKVAALEAA